MMQACGSNGLRMECTYMPRFKEPYKKIKKECDFKELKIEDMNQVNVKLLRFLIQVFC